MFGICTGMSENEKIVVESQNTFKDYIMKVVSILCLSVVLLVLYVDYELNSHMSSTEMRMTWGGGNCTICPGEANNTCSSSTCSWWPRSTQCYSDSGGNWKSCKESTHPEHNCNNDDNVSCGTRDECDEGQGTCSSSSYDCSCNSEPHYYVGCA